ncbi:nitrous oxide reductase accessory protein NosL [Arcobacter sp. LA11]|uniref:nitrous oxide reductase accessory protein NosL n=1 Tax=Arcobacter sp. LA11 TaxID=1898176 RepID=UPI0009F94488|nr:nitrous oxide reductase accessory protein NosL [Arcobacter sp. LA11]
MLTSKKFSLFILSTCLASTLTLSASEAYTMNYDENTRGLVRKMQIQKDPSWAAKIVNKNSKEFYFSSPKSMLEFYYNPEKWPSANTKNANELKHVIVTDYKTLKPIDAKYAFYVYGSNKISLAGDDLPAFENIADAKNFSENNNGTKILSFKELSNGLIQLLNGDI